MKYIRNILLFNLTFIATIKNLKRKVESCIKKNNKAIYNYNTQLKTDSLISWFLNKKGFINQVNFTISIKIKFFSHKILYPRISKTGFIAVNNTKVVYHLKKTFSNFLIENYNVSIYIIEIEINDIIFLLKEIQHNIFQLRRGY